MDNVVNGSWHLARRGDLLFKLHGYASDLDIWGCGICSKFRMDINRCKSKLANLVHLRDEQSIRNYNATKEKLVGLILQEDNFWRQRAKFHWLKDGDLNAKFFHSMATMRRKRNLIQGLKTDDGLEVLDLKGLRQVAQSYFDQLFMHSPSTHDPVVEVVAAWVSSTFAPV